MMSAGATGDRATPKWPSRTQCGERHGPLPMSRRNAFKMRLSIAAQNALPSACCHFTQFKITASIGRWKMLARTYMRMCKHANETICDAMHAWTWKLVSFLFFPFFLRFFFSFFFSPHVGASLFSASILALPVPVDTHTRTPAVCAYLPIIAYTMRCVRLNSSHWCSGVYLIIWIFLLWGSAASAEAIDWLHFMRLPRYGRPLCLSFVSHINTCHFPIALTDRWEALESARARARLDCVDIRFSLLFVLIRNGDKFLQQLMP